MKNKILTLLFFSYLLLNAETYYVSPNGDNRNDGKTSRTAWEIPDRGQPTYLIKDTDEGDKIVYVARACQFPEKGKVLIGNKEVEYSGRTGDMLVGCKGTPKAKRGTKVFPADGIYAKEGDRIIILEGIYTLKEKFSKENKEWAGGKDCVFYFNFSGSEDKPIVVEGKGNAIIDGEFKNRSIIIKGKDIKIRNLKLRRGGIGIFFSKNIEFFENHVFYGIHSIFVRYSENINIHHNLIYDFHGAWTEAGINIGDSKNIQIKNNTIVNCGRGINIWGRIEKINIKENLIAWCGTGFIKDEKVKISPSDIQNNLFWANGKVIWLQNLEKPDTKEDGNHYKGLNFKPDDIHKNPDIVNWYSWSDEFLSPHKNSVCFENGKNIGAKKGKDFPENLKYRKGENLLFNPSFEFDLYGWKGSSWWVFNKGEAGWEIKEGNTPYGKKYLHLYENPPKGKRNAPSVSSIFFPINKGKTYTISFYARGKGSINAGFTFPSWHGGSGIGKSYIHLTPEWKRYSVKIKLSSYIPDWVGVKFSSNCSSADIDAVKVEEGENSTDFSPEIEVFYKTNEYGILKPDGYIPLVIKNYSKKENATLFWKLFDPYGNVVDEGSFKIENIYEELKKVKLKEKLNGIYLFSYKVVDNEMKFLGGNNFRILFGNRIGKTKNRDFIAATPPYKNYSSFREFEKITKKLSSYGIGTFHLYAGLERIKEFIEEDTFEKYVDITKKYKINWLITPSDAKLFTGKRAFAPAPGNVEEDFKKIEKVVLNQGRITENQLIVWKNYIEKLVKKFKGKIKYYEILNEPNCFLNADEYVKIVRETSPLIKKIDKNAKIIAGSVVNAFRKPLYYKTMELSDEYFDYFSFHPYRFGIMNPEIQGPFREQMKMVKEDLKTKKKNKKIWLTEEGMGPGYERTRCIGSLFSYSIPLPSNYFSRDEIIWTQFGMRMYLTAFGEGAAGYNYHTLQSLIIDSEATPSLLLAALHTMADILGNSESSGQLNLGDDFSGYLFKDKRKTIAVLWKKDSEWGNKTEINLKYKGKLGIYDIFGKKVNYKDGKFNMDKYLYYLIFENLNSGKVQEIIEKAFENEKNYPELVEKPIFLKIAEWKNET